MTMFTTADIQERFGCEPIDAENIHHLMLLARARGVAGRWPRQEFETSDDWTDGERIDRIAAISGLEPCAVFGLYRAAHAGGLCARRRFH
jgi:hypothetical protein